MPRVKVQNAVQPYCRDGEAFSFMLEHDSLESYFFPRDFIPRERHLAVPPLNKRISGKLTALHATVRARALCTLPTNAICS
jgi:hypothetical protein